MCNDYFINIGTFFPQISMETYHIRIITIRLVDYINKEMDKNTPVNIYLDLSKAFDTIHFEVLVYKIGIME